MDADNPSSLGKFAATKNSQRSSSDRNEEFKHVSSYELWEENRQRYDYYCEICSCDISGEAPLELHNMGKRHMKNLKNLSAGELKRGCSSLSTPCKAKRPRSEYYCETCDCETGGANSFAAHNNGKRHAKNLEKLSTGQSVKRKTIEVGIECSELQGHLHDVEKPVVGLDYISELHKKSGAVLFVCNLCRGNYTVINIIEHLTSARHWLNYLKVVDKSTFDILMSLRLGKDAEYALLQEKMSSIEHSVGRGQPEVRREINMGAHDKDYRNRMNRKRHWRSSAEDAREHMDYQSRSKHNRRSLSESGEVSDESESRSHSSHEEEYSQRKKKYHKDHSAQPIPEEEVPIISKQSNAVKQLVVGFRYIEVRDSKSHQLPKYKCHLCQETFIGFQVIKHTTSYRHQKNYLKEIDYRQYRKIKAKKMSKQSKKKLISRKVHHLAMQEDARRE